MKTLTATQNEDGTYHVVITNRYEVSHTVGKGEVKDQVEGKMDIPRALIEITPIKSVEEARKTDRFMI